jgi:hypothetical protein
MAAMLDSSLSNQWQPVHRRAWVDTEPATALHIRPMSAAPLELLRTALEPHKSGKSPSLPVAQSAVASKTLRGL